LDGVNAFKRSFAEPVPRRRENGFAEASIAASMVVRAWPQVAPNGLESTMATGHPAPRQRDATAEAADPVPIAITSKFSRQVSLKAFCICFGKLRHCGARFRGFGIRASVSQRRLDLRIACHISALQNLSVPQRIRITVGTSTRYSFRYRRNNSDHLGPI
jgi:hypothetical protein